ncbi:phosphotransferase [Streptomyces sp. NPDC060194]|uniref:phosphotransferase n=1 Tax=Streptomyces sp. NPDC060194 TaxID=3347069 RepID=UPI00364D1E9B
MPRSDAPPLTTSALLALPPRPRPPSDTPPLRALLRGYGVGEPLGCVPVAQGLLNRGYRVDTAGGRYFLKHHLDGDSAAVVRRHRAVRRLAELGVPVAAPLSDAAGGTVTVVDGRCYALHPWVEGRHRQGAQLTAAQSRTLGALLGFVHACLARVMGAPAGEHPSADPAETRGLIELLLPLARGAGPYDAFDALAEQRLTERLRLLDAHGHRRPPPGGATGWVHGDFHPLNLLYRGTRPVAVVDWDRLADGPRAEEAVRAAAIFFLRPSGALDLEKVRAYAGAYRRAAGADGAELAAAVHRVWWERLNDFWMLRWRYLRHDRRADAQIPAASALVVWWTKEYEAVEAAFAE